LQDGNRGLPGGSSLAQILAENRGVRNRMRLPALKIGLILAWVDAHHLRHGDWPKPTSGIVDGAPETWLAVDKALRNGLRGLSGGSSLARLLAEQRGVRNLQDQPRLTIDLILKWADAHYWRTGKWPAVTAGPVVGTNGENWREIDNALRYGRRGLRGRLTLSKFLLKHRGQHAMPNPLSMRKIAAWAKAYFQEHGHWPRPSSGQPDETWHKIHRALRSGLRGLPGGKSLLKLFGQERGAPRGTNRSKLTVAQILAWADEQHGRTGKWPGALSGPIIGAAGETWLGVDAALRHGGRGLPGGSSLPVFLAAQRGAWNQSAPPPLTIAQILAWADQHHRATGRWPRTSSQPVDGVQGETWMSIDQALIQGRRGLAGRSSLAKLLAEHRRQVQGV
jgi:hypothetical protein